MNMNFITMLFKVILFTICISCALSRHAHYADLDDDEQALFRAAYDTPSYDHVEVADEDLSSTKLDLLKDVMWALKAKLKEIKAFNKAMAANILSTKLHLKDLKTLIEPIAHHHHKTKPSYSYQAPSYEAASYEQAPQVHGYDKPYAPQKPYAPHEQAYAPQNPYVPQEQAYAPQKPYSPQEQAYAPQKPYSPQESYNQPYPAPQQHAHDPYYGI